MEAPITEVSHDLSVNISGTEYEFEVTAHAVRIFSYYAIILTLQMKDKFYRDFDIEDAYLHQFYPVQNIESAISNIKALRTNVDWIVEQSYQAFEDAKWTFTSPNKEQEE